MSRQPSSAKHCPTQLTCPFIGAQECCQTDCQTAGVLPMAAIVAVAQAYSWSNGQTVISLFPHYSCIVYALHACNNVMPTDQPKVDKTKPCTNHSATIPAYSSPKTVCTYIHM